MIWFEWKRAPHHFISWFVLRGQTEARIHHQAAKGKVQLPLVVFKCSCGLAAPVPSVALLLFSLLLFVRSPWSTCVTADWSAVQEMSPPSPSSANHLREWGGEDQVHMKASSQQIVVRICQLSLCSTSFQIPASSNMMDRNKYEAKESEV